jgi:hypothetical protein
MKTVNFKKLLEKYIYYLQQSLCETGDLIPAETEWIDGTFNKIFTIEEQNILRKISFTLKLKN